MYRRVGARPVGGRSEFVVNPENVERLRPKVGEEVSIRTANLNDAELLAEIYDREPIRSIRPLSDYEIVLKYRHCVGQECEFILAQDGTASAYLLATTPKTRNGKTLRTVFEYAGDRQLVLSAIWSLAHETELRVMVEGDDVLGQLLEEVGIERILTKKPGTIAVIDFAKTMRKLLPFFASRLPATLTKSLDFAYGNERYIAWCADGTMEIDGITNMVWTLLGMPPNETVTNVRINGSMRELHERCLPIPLPSLEMNMI